MDFDKSLAKSFHSVIHVEWYIFLKEVWYCDYVYSSLANYVPDKLIKFRTTTKIIFFLREKMSNIQNEDKYVLKGSNWTITICAMAI